MYYKGLSILLNDFSFLDRSRVISRVSTRRIDNFWQFSIICKCILNYLQAYSLGVQAKSIGRLGKVVKGPDNVLITN